MREMVNAGDGQFRRWYIREIVNWTPVVAVCNACVIFSIIKWEIV
jgi:hypothetical protein